MPIFLLLYNRTSHFSKQREKKMVDRIEKLSCVTITDFANRMTAAPMKKLTDSGMKWDTQNEFRSVDDRVCCDCSAAAQKIVLNCITCGVQWHGLPAIKSIHAQKHTLKLYGCKIAPIGHFVFFLNENEMIFNQLNDLNRQFLICRFFPFFHEVVSITLNRIYGCVQSQLAESKAMECGIERIHSHHDVRFIECWQFVHRTHFEIRWRIQRIDDTSAHDGFDIFLFARNTVVVSWDFTASSSL